MPVEKWSDSVVVVHMANDPQFTDDLASLEQRLAQGKADAVLNLAGVTYINSSNIARLLKVEQTDEPTEIVIHVNMLKEGWDVTNLYTIVPLRAANARTLIEQSIGRGLRLR